jgi:hypothetical protein
MVPPRGQHHKGDHVLRDTYTITVKDTARPGTAPVGRRLAQLLKIAKRRLDLKCIDIRSEETMIGCEDGPDCPVCRNAKQAGKANARNAGESKPATPTTDTKGTNHATDRK